MMHGIVQIAWNSHGQHEYLLIYSFKLKSAFDTCQLFCQSLCFVAKCVLWPNDTSYIAKVSVEVNRKCPLRNTARQYNFQFPTLTMNATMHSVTDRQTDDSIMSILSAKNKSSSLLSALEVFYENALYKFTFDIDVILLTSAMAINV